MSMPRSSRSGERYARILRPTLAGITALVLVTAAGLAQAAEGEFEDFFPESFDREWVTVLGDISWFSPDNWSPSGIPESPENVRLGRSDLDLATFAMGRSGQTRIPEGDGILSRVHVVGNRQLTVERDTADILLESLSFVIGFGNVSQTLDEAFVGVIGDGARVSTAGTWMAVANNDPSSASLTIEQGGEYSSPLFETGPISHHSSTSSIRVTDTGSRLSVRDMFLSWQSGDGLSETFIQVENRGTLETERTARLATPFLSSSSSRAEITVSDFLSRWVHGESLNAEPLFIGYDTNPPDGGFVTIEDGGLLESETPIRLARGGDGELLIAGTSGNRGEVLAPQINRSSGGDSPGQARIIFDGGLLTLTEDQDALFSGFGGSDLVEIRSGGAFIDPDGFEIRTAHGFSGPGRLVLDGDGTLELGANSSHDRTVISGRGTLRIDRGAQLGGGLEFFSGTGALELADSFETDRRFVLDNLGAIELQGETLRLTGAFDSVRSDGILRVRGSGRLELDGSGDFDANLNVRDSDERTELHVFGDYPGQSRVDIWRQNKIRGNGRLGGLLRVRNGVLRPDTGSPGTLRVGELALEESDVLPEDTEWIMDLRTPDSDGGSNTRVHVDVDVTLVGELHIIDAGGFDQGSYTLLTYDGELTDDGLELASLPGGESPDDWRIDYSTPGEVRLVIRSELDAQPPAQDFGTLCVGETSSALSFQLQNLGTADPVEILAISGTDGTAFDRSGGSCQEGGTLEPGDTCSLDYIFEPTGEANFSTTVTIEHDGLDGTETLTLEGTGGQPEGTVSPGSIDFGAVDIHAAGNNIDTVLVSNQAGSCDLQIDSIALGGNDPGAFTSTDCPDTLSPGNSCNVEVGFSPDAVGSFEAELSVASNAPQGTQTVTLLGEGVEAITDIDPSSVDFGAVRVDQASEAETITVTNVGSGNLQLDTLELAGSDAGAFSITDDGCSVSTLEPGQNCSVNIELTPPERGTLSAEIEIPSNTAEGLDVVTLAGEGVAPVATVDTDSVSFGEVRQDNSADPVTVVVSNQGDVELAMDTVEVTGPQAEEFSAANDCAGQTLAVEESCELEMGFTPADTGARQAEVVIASDDPDGSVAIALDGTGIASEVSLDVETVEFGEIRVDETAPVERVTLTNTGTAVLNLGSLSIEGTHADEFVLADDTCSSAELEPEAQCSIELDFTPAETGERTADLLIPSDDPDGPARLALNGTGIEPELSLSPEVVDFGEVEVGEESERLVAVIGNTGSDDMVVSLLGETEAPFAGSDGGNDCPSETPFTLEPDEECELGYRAAPEARGEATSTIGIETDAPDGNRELHLEVVGLAPEASLSATTLDFGNVVFGATESRSLIITNIGDIDLVIEEIEIPEPGFDIVSSDCLDIPATIVPEASCQIEVLLNEDGSLTTPGDIHDEMVLHTNAPDDQITVDLQATILEPIPVPIFSHWLGGLLLMIALLVAARPALQRRGQPSV